MGKCHKEKLIWRQCKNIGMRYNKNWVSSLTNCLFLCIWHRSLFPHFYFLEEFSTRKKKNFNHLPMKYKCKSCREFLLEFSQLFSVEEKLYFFLLRDFTHVFFKESRVFTLKTTFSAGVAKNIFLKIFSICI